MTTQATPASFTIAQWCARRNVSRKLTYQLINSGELRTYKIGRRRFITVEADRDFIAQREAEAAV